MIIRSQGTPVAAQRSSSAAKDFIRVRAQRAQSIAPLSAATHVGLRGRDLDLLESAATWYPAKAAAFTNHIFVDHIADSNETRPATRRAVRILRLAYGP